MKLKMPVFPNFMYELTRSWTAAKAMLSLPFTQFLVLKDMEAAGLANILPMDETLAVRFTPKPNTASSKPTLSSKPCRFSTSQLEKTYSVLG